MVLGVTQEDCLNNAVSCSGSTLGRHHNAAMARTAAIERQMQAESALLVAAQLGDTAAAARAIKAGASVAATRGELAGAASPDCRHLLLLCSDGIDTFLAATYCITCAGMACGFVSVAAAP
jgi:hypothetical protein